MKYFAYGSNMSLARLQKRCPSAIVEEIATLSKYKMFFHKPGVDGTGKADIIWTGNNSDVVHGVIFHIANKDVKFLDRAEGNGTHYQRDVSKVRTVDGNRHAVQIYTALIIEFEKELCPSKQYLQYLVDGTVENRLPVKYIEKLKSIETMQTAHQRTYYVPKQQSMLFSQLEQLPIVDTVDDTALFYNGNDSIVTSYTLSKDEAVAYDEGYEYDVFETLCWTLGIDEWTTDFDRAAESMEIYHIDGTLLRTYYKTITNIDTW